MGPQSGLYHKLRPASAPRFQPCERILNLLSDTQVFFSPFPRRFSFLNSHPVSEGLFERKLFYENLPSSPGARPLFYSAQELRAGDGPVFFFCFISCVPRDLILWGEPVPLIDPFNHYNSPGVTVKSFPSPAPAKIFSITDVFSGMFVTLIPGHETFFAAPDSAGGSLPFPEPFPQLFFLHVES